MKRKVERKQLLPGFMLTIDQLEVLIARLCVLFPASDRVGFSISIKLKSESIDFESIEELRAYSQLPSRVTNFSIWVSDWPRRVWISAAGKSLGDRSTVYVEGESDAWCAGVIETVQSFINSHRVWYHWFLSAPIGWVLMLVLYIPGIYFSLQPKGAAIERTVLAGWFGALFVLFLLWVGRGRLLPASVLRIAEEENILRRYTPELTLLIALASAAFTVVGWFVGK